MNYPGLHMFATIGFLMFR